MQSSLRARRESPASGSENAVAAGRASGARDWFPGLFRLFGAKPAPQPIPAPEANPLLAFPSETGPRPEAVPAAPTVEALKKPAFRPSASGRRPKLLRPILIVVLVIALPSLGVLALRRFPIPLFTASAPRAGTLTIATQPAGSDVLIDGERRGATPLTLAITPGAHTLTIRSGRDERVVPLTIAPGAEVTQYYEMKAAEPVALVGRLSVVTDPPGARVTVDGRPRGTSPVTVADLTAEDHKVTVTTDAGSIERTVAVAAGSTASVMFSLPKVSGPVGGWLSISAPFDVEVAENEDVIGSSGTNRIMLAAGRHDIVLMNRSLGYQEARRIDVAAGKTMAIRVDPPKVSVSVNARPWAEIMLDGVSVGQTPLANLSVTVGPHEMVFRHPQLGERKQTIVVSVKGPNRIAADLTK
jgi:hypothetical protein